MSEVETLEAGRELDALVAEKVMGWYRKGVRWIDPDLKGATGYTSELRYDASSNSDFPLWQPSTDIAAAWEVWEKVNAVFPKAWAVYSEDDGNVSVEYYDAGYCGSREEGCGAYGYARGYGDAAPAPFPLALCRAALKAVERAGSPGPGGTA